MRTHMTTKTVSGRTLLDRSALPGSWSEPVTDTSGRR
jgi:hypothetical protein